MELELLTDWATASPPFAWLKKRSPTLGLILNKGKFLKGRPHSRPSTQLDNSISNTSCIDKLDSTFIHCWFQLLLRTLKLDSFTRGYSFSPLSVEGMKHALGDISLITEPFSFWFRGSGKNSLFRAYAGSAWIRLTTFSNREGTRARKSVHKVKGLINFLFIRTILVSACQFS